MVGRVGEWLGLMVVGTDRDGDRSGMRIGAVFPETEIGDDLKVIRAWRSCLAPSEDRLVGPEFPSARGRRGARR
jgi:hypothetical protein